MSFFSVVEFEKKLADFYSAPYAVATDCCTHALELCLIHKQIKTTKCPEHTYISVPFTLTKLGVEWDWCDDQWQNYYYLHNTNIIDAAVYFKEGSYIPGTLMCLSFQFKKPLSLGRGGAILCDKYEDYVALKKLSYDGRFGDQPWSEQEIDTLGYHYYMTPETAIMGIDKLKSAQATKTWGWVDYPFLPSFKVFR
jgi:dTDP-4-amino-4,6-dideoxygalactose transaminase